MALPTYRIVWEDDFAVIQHREENPTSGGPDWRPMTDTDFDLDLLKGLLDLGITVNL